MPPVSLGSDGCLFEAIPPFIRKAIFKIFPPTKKA